MGGDVLVPAGSSLEILPGTIIYVRYSESTKIDPEYLSSATELLIRGALRIAGTATAPVRFIPLGAPDSEPLAWAGILLDGAEAAVIEEVEITRAETGVLCVGASPVIRASRLTGCRYGIVAQHKSAPQILENHIEGGEGGIFCWWGSNPVIRGNRIAGNDEEGIYVDRTSFPAVDGNQVAGNGIGLAAFQDGADIEAAQFIGNRRDILWLAGDGGARP